MSADAGEAAKALAIANPQIKPPCFTRLSRAASASTIDDT